MYGFTFDQFWTVYNISYYAFDISYMFKWRTRYGRWHMLFGWRCSYGSLLEISVWIYFWSVMDINQFGMVYGFSGFYWWTCKHWISFEMIVGFFGDLFLLCIWLYAIELYSGTYELYGGFYPICNINYLVEYYVCNGLMDYLQYVNKYIYAFFLWKKKSPDNVQTLG